jgi:hypothetical protein
LNAIICFSEHAYRNAYRNQNDVFILVFSKLESINEDSTHIYVPMEPCSDKKLVEVFTKMALSSNSSVVNSSLNNSYYYGVATVASVCEKIHQILSNISPGKVILCGDPNSKYIPIYFTAWGESSKNLFTTSDCLYHYVKERISNDFIVNHKGTSFLSTFLSRARKYIRILVVPIVCFIYSLKKCRRHPLFVTTPTHKKTFFIVRTGHQFNVARNIITSLSLRKEDVLFVEIESLSSTGLLNSIMELGYSVLSPHSGMRGLVNSVLSFVCSYAKMITLGFYLRGKEFSYKGVRYSLRDFFLDSCIQPQILMYEKQLVPVKCQISKVNSSQVFSFEQVSPQAYFDHKVLGEVAQVSFIKSTLIQEIQMPCISWGERFLVNDKSELALKDCSFLNSGSILYSGSPKYSAIYNLKKNNASKLGSVLFATQPHESEVNQMIIETLVNAGKKLGFVTVVRKHPRDMKEYSLTENQHLVFSTEAELYHQLAKSDLVVSRTSTILEECIYIGVPYLSCLFSSKDRAYSAGYLEPESGLITNDSSQLEQALSEYNQLKKDFKAWRQQYLRDFKKFSI